MNRITLAAMVALFAAAAGLTPAMAEPTRRVQGAATLEDIAPTPPKVAEAVLRYQSSRPAVLGDWLSDGSLVIATRFGTTSQLHRVAAPMGARTQLTFYGEPVAGTAHVPGSDAFFFTKDTGGDEWAQIFRMSPGGEAVQFTQTGTRNSLPVVSDDGKQIFWTHATKGSGSFSVMGAGAADPASARKLYEDPGYVTVEDVSPDGRKLLLLKIVSSSDIRILLLDVASGAVTPLAPGPATSFAAPQFANGGKTMLVISDRDSDTPRLAQIDVATGRVAPLSPASPWEVDAFDVSRAGVVAYSTNEDGYSVVRLMTLTGAAAGPSPTLPKGVVGDLRFSPDGSQLAIALSTPQSPGDIYAWRLRDKALVRWTASELGPLDAKALAEPKLVRFKSFDGVSVPAFVYRPKAAAPGARTPVLIMIHGGPEGQERPGWNPGVQYFAAQLGATVIVPNVRGSTGYGRRYVDLDNGPKREDSVKDIGALLDWIAAQPDLDARRVVVDGGSYGGYMVLAAMTHYADRLAGGIESFGISNWVSFLQNTEAYRRDFRRGEYGDERDPAMRAVFDRISPIAGVAKMTKPMLVQQGVNDPRVPKSESDQIVAALRAQGTPVSYLVFADEGHGFRKRPNQDLARGVETVFLQQVFGAP